MIINQETPPATKKEVVEKFAIWAAILSIFSGKFKWIVFTIILVAVVWIVIDYFNIYPRLLMLGVDFKSALNRIVYEFRYGLCIAKAINPAECGPTVETYYDVLQVDISAPETIGASLSFGNTIALSIPQKILDIDPQATVRGVVVKVDGIMNENKETLLKIKGEYKSSECVLSKSCDLNKDFNKKTVSVWFSGPICDMKKEAEYLYINYDISYDFTTDSGIKKVGVSKSQDMIIRQEERKIVGPVSIRIEMDDVYVLEKMVGKTVPTTISLMNNGDGEAEIKEITINQMHDPRIKPIKFDKCTIQPVQKDDKTTFKLEKSYMSPLEGTTINCNVIIPDTDSSHEIILTPSVSYSYSMEMETRPILINYKIC